MPLIVGISGSLRTGSLNTALLNACIESAPAGTQIVPGSIKGIPLYDGDLEAAEGLPDTVVALKKQIAAADGLLIVTPEYNSSMPGVLKNAIDWLTRGGDMKVTFGGKPVAIAGASPGGFGTILSQSAWLPVIKALGAVQWSGGKLLVSRADTLLDADGRLSDEKARKEIVSFVAGFAGFVSARADK